MSIKNKIDFALVIVAVHCNPNGDPLNGNRPRQDWDGYGEISDVCLKRKIRNRWMDMGENILNQPDDRVQNGLYSVKARIDACDRIPKAAKRGVESGEYVRIACKEWLDVRAFGQVLAFKKESPAGGSSIGVRGPVTIQFARTLEPIDIQAMQFTKSTNLEDTKDGNRDSTTLFTKSVIDKGVYVAYGSVNSQLASLTGFSEADAEKLKEALRTMFVNDESAARPSGSMEVAALYWWEHSCPDGQYSPAKVYRSLVLEPIAEYPYFKGTLCNLKGLIPEIYE